MPAINRSYAGGHYMLSLDGKPCGFLKSVEGGGIKAEVVTERISSGFFARKHIAGVSYEPFTLEVDLSMGPAFYDWIAAMIEGKAIRKNGAVILADQNNEIRSQIDFSNALITEITFPASDGSSKDAVYLTVKFKPEVTHFVKGSGKKITGKITKMVQKRWLPANFRLEIPGLDCTKVNRIDSFTIKQNTTVDSIGEARDYQLEPTSLEFPNLAFYLPESKAKSWIDWHEDFVIKGNCGQDQEKTGTLTFLAPNFKQELAQIDFFNLGIFSFTPDNVEARNEQIRRVKFEMYCESLKLKINSQ
jgi:hypothetical protein